jgi:hypothetical protein
MHQTRLEVFLFVLLAETISCLFLRTRACSFLLLLTLLPLLLHPLTAHQVACRLLDASQSLVGIPVLARCLHGVDGLVLVLLAGGGPGLVAGDGAYEALVGC